MTRLLAVLVAAFMLSACASLPERESNILIGTGVGAGVGALIGSTYGPQGGWTGAAIGGAVGGLIGSVIRPGACYFRNRRGEIWQIPCEYPDTKPTACFVSGWFGWRREVPCETLFPYGPPRRRISRRK
jgi:YMGG-like Gly-zipper